MVEIAEGQIVHPQLGPGLARMQAEIANHVVVGGENAVEKEANAID
jgi:hypothetical protein